MCGIAGQFCYGSTLPDRALLEKMSERLAHRGPDGQGVYIKGRTALAHRRLAIIDLSDDARQPIANEDGSLWLVYNGEIYNFVELRAELIAKGHTFRSKTDSEVILHAYEEWGTECLSRLNGMWAFALWDEKQQQLFCARDRFGIKPFYYTGAGGSFLFASEIKALLAHTDVGKKPDDETLLTYLAWGVHDHTEKTMFDGIFQLRPAHAVVVTPAGTPAPYRYWDVTVNPSVSSDTPDKESAARFLSLLREAVRIHLRSDVAVGTCLSGGIDSSTLAVLINELVRSEAPQSVGARQKTFSAVFDDRRFDESRYIDTVVAATAVDAYRTRPGPELLLEKLPHLVYTHDEPFGSLSQFAQYCVMELASRQVKVVLDGQGADEQLGGYLAYEGCMLRSLVLRGHCLTAIQELVGMVRHHRTFIFDSFRQLRIRKKRRNLIRMPYPLILRYRGTLADVLKRELMSTNLPSLLHYEDRLSMAFSIESRVPYLDYRLVEYIASLPQDNKIRHGITKYLLRKAIRGIVPDEIRCRMDKMGFVAPEEVWMREELRPFVLDMIGSDSFKNRKYWDAAGVAEEYRLFLEGKHPYSPEIWRFVCTELWLRMFFDNRSSAGIHT